MKTEPETTINTLNDLIAALRDSQECLREAAERVDSKDLKLTLMDFSTQRAVSCTMRSNALAIPLRAMRGQSQARCTEPGCM